MPDPASRYAGLEIATSTVPDGTGGHRVVRYLRRRFPPQPADAGPLTTHLVVRGDRLDLLAAAQLGDPLLFWRICDVNLMIHPDELTSDRWIGRTVQIPGPGT